MIEFWSDDTSVDAGQCTTLHWNVAGVREVYLDDKAVNGRGKREVCPREPQSHTLTVIYQDRSAEDFPAFIDVSGSVDTPKLPEPVEPPILLIPPLQVVPFETAEPLLW